MRKILFLLPILFLSSCFSVDKPTLTQIVKDAENICPLASAMNYNIRNEDKYLGEIKIASIQKGNETLCYIDSAYSLDESLNYKLNDFFTRKFYKISDVLYMMYAEEINDGNSIYIVRKTIDGWLIYTNCKNGDKDCLIITSTNSFKPTIENEIIRQEPTYWLEEIK